LRILVVDDNPVNVDLVVDIAESMNWDVLSAFDGEAAIQTVQTQDPDVIVLDVNMPGMSGYEVCAKLKADPKTMHIPIIMLTAQADVDARVKGLAVGADDYVTKPYSARELIARIETRARAKEENDGLRQMQHTIRQTFERFVNPSIVQQLLQDPTRVELGGKLQEVTVMFTDLEGFTSVSEVTSPSALLNMLNAHHKLVVDILLGYGGTVDKFIGDAVMGLFNTPLEQPDHVQRAIEASLAIQEALPRFHQQFPPEHRMKINIGIHTGTAIVGNVGTSQIMDFTAVGDTVNIAARLQSQSHGGSVLASKAVRDAIGHAEHVLFLPIGQLMLKGRSQLVTAFSVKSKIVAEV